MNQFHQAHQRRIRMSRIVVTIWEQKCCGGPRWNAARRCDRCGTPADTKVSDLTIVEAMAGYRFAKQAVQPPAAVATTPAIAAVAQPLLTGLASPQPPVPAQAATTQKTQQRLVRHDEDDLARPVRHRATNQEMEHALVFGLWWLAGVVACIMGIGAAVEFQARDYVSAMFWAVGAASTPTSVLTIALDGPCTTRQDTLDRHTSYPRFWFRRDLDRLRSKLALVWSRRTDLRRAG